MVKITHTGAAKTPLKVTFNDDAESEHTIDVDAGAVQTFIAFQKAVANELGVWVQDPNRRQRPKDARESWQLDVGRAFEAGRKKEKGTA
ncbi:MAG: hypothetical protein ACYTG0_31990 [Planctomycetota bacterium]